MFAIFHAKKSSFMAYLGLDESEISPGSTLEFIRYDKGRTPILNAFDINKWWVCKLHSLQYTHIHIYVCMCTPSKSHQTYPYKNLILDFEYISIQMYNIYIYCVWEIPTHYRRQTEHLDYPCNIAHDMPWIAQNNYALIDSMQLQVIIDRTW